MFVEVCGGALCGTKDMQSNCSSYDPLVVLLEKSCCEAHYPPFDAVVGDRMASRKPMTE